MIELNAINDVLMIELNAINDAEIFESNIRDIYPDKVELRRENDNNANTTFLDLDIKMKNNKFQIGPFPYSIVKISEKSSNVPSNIFYMSI